MKRPVDVRRSDAKPVPQSFRASWDRTASEMTSAGGSLAEVHQRWWRKAELGRTSSHYKRID